MAGFIKPKIRETYTSLGWQDDTWRGIGEEPRHHIAIRRTRGDLLLWGGIEPRWYGNGRYAAEVLVRVRPAELAALDRQILGFEYRSPGQWQTLRGDAEDCFGAGLKAALEAAESVAQRVTAEDVVARVWADIERTTKLRDLGALAWAGAWHELYRRLRRRQNGERCGVHLPQPPGTYDVLDPHEPLTNAFSIAIDRAPDLLVD
ncbi:MAG: hypothetical protein AAGE18_01060 [Pseudomonadota bacterium]